VPGVRYQDLESDPSWLEIGTQVLSEEDLQYEAVFKKEKINNESGGGPELDRLVIFNIVWIWGQWPAEF